MVGITESGAEFPGGALAAAQERSFFNHRFRDANPRNFPTEQVLKFPQLAEKRATYNRVTNKCHAHAQGVLRELGF
jgi:hypothetical protein